MSDTRPKLKQLFQLVSKRKITKVVVEHKDRLTRFNFGIYEERHLKVVGGCET